jgi:hypothetical protein
MDDRLNCSQAEGWQWAVGSGQVGSGLLLHLPICLLPTCLALADGALEGPNQPV